MMTKLIRDLAEKAIKKIREAGALEPYPSEYLLRCL